MKKTIGIAVAMSALAVCANTPPAITNVRASQREGTKLVDIYYDAADADNDLLKVRIEISDNDGAKYSVPAFSLTGDIGEGIAPGTGKHIVWDAGTDWDGEYSDQMRVKVFAIDAQGFPGMEWGNEVPPGGFLMGQDGGAEGSGPSRHVNIPWSYWLGKYEVTAQQYCDFLNAALVSGYVTRNGTTEVLIEKGMLPGYNDNYSLLSIGDGQRIRWNVNNFEVVGSCSNLPIIVTQIGALAFCRYYGYDLPTDAEWEKAARGPDHDDQDEHLVYPWGNTINGGYANYKYSGDPYDNGFTPVGYYDGNQTPVGPDVMNGYGLYDVVGNAAEWTRSYYSNYPIESYSQQENLYSARNRNISFTDTMYVTRGGSCGYGEASNELKIYYRYPVYAGNGAGFRVTRRAGPDISSAKLLVKETFEDWNTFTNATDILSINSNIGQWVVSNAVSCVADETGKWLRLSNGRVYLPNVDSGVLYVRFKVRSPSSNGSQWIYFRAIYQDGSTWYNSVKPAASEFWQCSLIAREPNVKDCYFDLYSSSYGAVDIDDLEIWTIPRTIGE